MKEYKSQSPLCLKRCATFPHTGAFVWSNLSSLVWGRCAVRLACLTDCWSLLLLCLLGHVQSPGCGWYLPFEDFQRCRPDGRQPRVDLGAGSCQDRFPPRWNKKNRDVKHAPCPKFLGFTLPQRDSVCVWPGSRSSCRL